MHYLECIADFDSKDQISEPVPKLVLFTNSSQTIGSKGLQISGLDEGHPGVVKKEVW